MNLFNTGKRKAKNCKVIIKTNEWDYEISNYN